MKQYLSDLEKQARKKLSKEETEQMVGFYEEMINDRVLNGEKLEDVLKDYEINKVIKAALPEIILKREKSHSKNIWQTLLILFSTPILIPLAIVYLALIIVAFSIFLSGIVMSLSSILAIIPYLIEVFSYSNQIWIIIGLVSIGAIALTLLCLLGILLAKGSYELTKYMIKGIMTLVSKKGENK